MRFLVASNLRTHIRKDETFLAQQQNDVADDCFKCAGLVGIAGFKLNQREELLGIKTRNIRGDFDVTEVVRNAFFQGKSDEEIASVRREFGDTRDNPNVGVTIVEVELPQQFTVEGKAVGIVVVAGYEKVPPVTLLGGNNLF